jgi:tetratricopeptide (TPR) repeat protein
MVPLKHGEPSVRGTLANDPLPRLLAGLVSQGATGTLELSSRAARVAQILLIKGGLTKVKAMPLYLGAVAYELGFVRAEDVNATLAEIAQAKRLHGAVLLEKKLLDEQQLRHCLAVQAQRKVHELFGSPPDTTFEFFPYYDALSAFGGPDAPSSDLRPSIWHGIRAFPPTGHVKSVVGAAGRTRFRLAAAAADVRGMGFDDEELAFVEGLRAGAIDLTEVTGGSRPDPKRRELVLYFLLLLGCLVRESSPPKQMVSGMRPRVTLPNGVGDPALTAKLFDRAYVASQAGNLDLADTLCYEAQDSDPKSTSVACLKIWLRALRPNGQSVLATQRAVAELSGIIAAHDDSVPAHFFRGQLYKRLGRHERAAQDFRQVLTHEPKRVDAQAELRLCLSRLRKN